MAKPASQADGAESLSSDNLKPMLILSKREPVSCAIGMTKDKQGIVRLHKKLKPRKLMAELKSSAREAKVDLDTASLRFGRASIDGDTDSGKVVFTVNKEAPAALRVKVLEKLRRVGFQKCEIGVDQKLEEEDDHEPATADADAPPPAAPASAGPSAPAPPSPAPAAPTPGSAAEAAPQPDATGAPAAGPDASAITARLTGLLRQVAAAGASAPPALGQIAGVAREALRSQDLARAGKACDALEKMLAHPAQGAAQPPRKGDAKVAHGSPKFETGRKVWLGTRAKLRSDIDAALDEIASHYSNDNPAVKEARNRVDRTLDQFDDSLAHKLAEVSKNKDAASHTKLVREAEAIISRYRSYVANEQTLALLDKNPFHPLQVQKTLDSALSALEKVVERV